MNKRIMSWGLLLLAVLFLGACRKDKSDDNNLRIAMTDAPVEDARVKGVFITVAELRVDGAPLEGFSPVTFDISAYQKGATRLLAETRLEPGTYREITLVLDYGLNASGQAPGCWVEEFNGTKHALQSTSTEIRLNKTFSLNQDAATTIVLDFDLRKSLRRASGGSLKYALVSHTELTAAIRVLVQGQTGVISGQCDNPVTSSDRILVYAYQKGTFNVLLEGIALQGLAFRNAVNSAAVDAQGRFEMHFLPPGDYELVYVACKDMNGDGDLDIQGTLLLQVLTGQDLRSVKVSAENQTTVNVRVTGLTPL
jgi:hypothetical protein